LVEKSSVATESGKVEKAFSVMNDLMEFLIIAAVIVFGIIGLSRYYDGEQEDGEGPRAEQID
jgi:hypothetical protein